MNLVENREVAYKAIFEGELPYESRPDIHDIGLSGLWRVHTTKLGVNGDELTKIHAAIPDYVCYVLKDHELRSRSDTVTNSVFCIIDTNILEVVSGITSQAFLLWEKSLYRNNEDSVITGRTRLPQEDKDNERLVHSICNESLIVETAAAVVRVLPIFSKNKLNPTSTESNNIAKIIANWGPEFLVKWMDGTILKQWLSQGNLDDNQIAEWLETIDTSTRKRFIVGNITDPLSALDRAKNNLEMLDDETIAKYLGWTVEKVGKNITPSLRKRFAVHNINDPLSGIGDYVNGILSFGGTKFSALD